MTEALGGRFCCLRAIGLAALAFGSTEPNCHICSIAVLLNPTKAAHSISAGNQTLFKPVFSYPPNDEDNYLTWFGNSFQSVFIGTNPFLRVPGFEPQPNGDWIPPEVNTAAKRSGEKAGVSWRQIADMCGFPTIAHVERALGLTGSKRLDQKYASVDDTDKLLEVCRKNSVFMPDEGFLSPVAEIALGCFLRRLGHEQITSSDHFGTSSVITRVDDLLHPERSSKPEMCTSDKSVFVAIYTDYHYFLVCQTKESRSKANPASFFEGFFAQDDTNDLWGAGSLLSS